ncbi:MAG: glycosyltransferase family 2 protein [Magnetococcus sp. YQC-3]
MSNPSLVIVIPCHDEPDLLLTLNALWQCPPAPSPVAVVVVINGADDDPPVVQARNRQTLTDVQAWLRSHPMADRSLHLLFEPNLPQRQAGVGTARKIGMDWAMSRFAEGGREEGVIVCLDADCLVAENYLQALHAHFAAHPRTPGCSLYFEHRWEGLPPRHRQGILHYELFLRYYVQGLRWSGFPHAFHTVGSSMAVRALPYQQQGGMNRRKAGEDFYFLQKIIPLGGFTDLTSTTVFPSPRLSCRVPFGTGRAMADWLQGAKDPGLVYDPQVFQDLGLLFAQWERLRTGEVAATLAEMPEMLRRFLVAQQWPERLVEMRANSTTPATFRKRFFQEFNAFHVLKYIHFATEHGGGKVPIQQAADRLLSWMGVAGVATESEALLDCYRQLDREGWWRVMSG